MQENHGNPERAGRALLRPLCFPGRQTPLDILQAQAEQLPGLLRRVPATRGRPVGSQGHHREGLGKVITPFAKRLSLPRDQEIHAVILVKTMIAQEIDSTPGPLQPLRPGLHRPMQRRQQPGEATLEPDRLVIIEQGPVPFPHGQVASVRGVQRPGQPEWQGVLQQARSIERSELAEFLLLISPHHFLGS